MILGGNGKIILGGNGKTLLDGNVKINFFDPDKNNFGLLFV